MNKPFFQAFLAALYIVLISLIMGGLGRVNGGEDTLVTPMLALSLFVLSAAVMGFLFLSQPLQLYLDGKKTEAVSFFGKTVGSFCIFVILFLILNLV